MRTGVCLAIAALLLPTVKMAADELLNRISADVTAEGMLRIATTLSNPGSRFYQRDSSLSEISVSANYLHLDQPVQVETGCGHMLSDIDAGSFMRLSAKTSVWGHAHFSTGQLRDIKWNNAIDYRLISPYVIGDSVGGNLSTRQYDISGGYAGAVGAWTLGAQAAYRATIGYRNRDPRIKAVVSDLEIKLGASRHISSSYVISVGADMRVYNQENDVAFYNPNNDIRSYPLMGLGNYNSRFSDIGDSNTAYTGVGFGGNIGVVSLRKTGLYANAGFMYQPIRQIMRNFNNLDLTQLRTYAVQFTAGYPVNISNVCITPRIDGTISRKLGFENLYGSSVGNNYMKIGQRRNYRHDVAHATIAFSAGFQAGKEVRLEIEPNVDFSYTLESYRKPRRAVGATAFSPGLSANIQWHVSPRVLLNAQIWGNQKFASTNRDNLTGLDSDSSLGMTVEHNFAMLTSDATAMGGYLEAFWLMQSPRLALFIKLQCQNVSWHHHGNALAAELSAGVKF